MDKIKNNRLNYNIKVINSKNQSLVYIINNFFSTHNFSYTEVKI